MPPNKKGPPGQAAGRVFGLCNVLVDLRGGTRAIFIAAPFAVVNKKSRTPPGTWGSGCAMAHTPKARTAERLNRHQRRRQARVERDWLIRLDIVDDLGLLRLFTKEPQFAGIVATVRRAMWSDSPPICAACDAEVRTAALWAIISYNRQTVIAAICGACGARRDLYTAVMRLAAPGARPVQPLNLHTQGGRA